MTKVLKEEVEGTVLLLDPKRVKPFPENPRKKFKRISQLAQSIKRAGQRQPVEVFPNNEKPGFDYELVDGERRLRACLLGNMPIRAFVTERPDPRTHFISSVAANFGREDHDVLETSDMLAKLEEMSLSQTEMSEICGKSQTWVSQHLLLQKLHEDVRTLLVPSDDDEEFHSESGRKLRRKAPLSFQIAMLLVPFSHEEQKKHSKAVQGKSFNDARRAILRASEKAGIARPTRNVSPDKRLAKLEAALKELDEALSPCLDMSKPKFLELFSAADRAVVRKLAGMMEESSFHLSECGDLLSEIVNKPLKALRA